MTAACKDLRRALYDWRREHALEIFGESVVETLGAKLLVPDEVVERLVSCSQAFKIITVPDILKETGWTYEDNWLQDLGESLLALLHAHFSIPQPPANAVTRTGRRQPTQKHCTNCGSPDHIRTYYFQFFSESFHTFHTRLKHSMPQTPEKPAHIFATP